MNVALRFLFICFLCSSRALVAEWGDQTTTATATTDIFGVDFVNTYTGWIVGGIAAVNTTPTSSYYAKTTDAGKTWKTKILETTQILHDVDFVDAMHGWIVGESGLILVTADGGTTWTQQSSPVPEIFYDIYMLDTLNGYIAGGGMGVLGADGRNNGVNTPRDVLKTTNGGKNWTKTTRPANSDQYSIYSVYPLDKLTLFCGTVFGIFKSLDGGTTWIQAKALPQNFFVHSFYFFTPTRGIACGGSCAEGQLHLYYTDDAGLTWTADTVSYGGSANADHFSLYSISGLGDKNAWVVGNLGTILSTTNAGLTWAHETSSATTDLYNVKFVNTGRGWAVGKANVVVEYFIPNLAIATDSTSLDYGTVTDTTPLTQSFMVKNTTSGAGTLNVKLTVNGDAFKITSATSFPLATGASKQVDVMYTPSDSLSKGEVIVESEAKTTPNPLRVMLKGIHQTTAKAFSMKTNVLALNFGSTENTTPIDSSFTVENVGTEVLNVSLTISGNAFSLTRPASFALPGLSSQSVPVRYTPSDTMSTGDVTVVSEAPESPILVTLIGRHGTVGVRDEDALARGFFLGQNYPNPFSHSTAIAVDINAGSQGGEFTVYDVFGRMLSRETVARGATTLLIDDALMPDGMYFYALRSAGRTVVRSMTKVR